MRRFLIPLFVAFAFIVSFAARAETVSIVVPSNAAPRVVFGAQKLVEALKAIQLEPVVVHSDPKAGLKIFISLPSPLGPGSHILWGNKQEPKVNVREAYWLTPSKQKDGMPIVMGSDDSGTLYGCLELAQRIRDTRQLPTNLHIGDKPAMTLRGTCIGMQKTYILPGRKVYEYPYTPELFPWFYDKAMWTEYLDFLVQNRMNTLYLWAGHPFASLVRLKDYPDAVEVSPEVFDQNAEMFRWLTTECDKRGIWLVQMFYNIFLPKPLADKNHISTQLDAPTPLASDYTRKSIAEFVKQYPNVGLMVCLGEALKGTENQTSWATNTILPGVLDGMRAAGLKEQPPVVIRTHAMDAEKIIPACFTVYSNLFTETKYNGESLTTYEPRGKSQATHLAMAKLGPHLVNIHILSNLEPFRYGATEFIRKSVLASRDRLGASGIHLYPLAYWNWPYSPDKVDPQLKQWDRDWIWFEAWARYAWNPDVNTNQDRAYWIGRLEDHFGCDTNAAGKILEAYNDAGEVAPMLIRRFGITEGNRQTLSLGMTLDQLVNPQKYGAIEDLWLSQAPPGERLQEYVEKEKKHEPHVGETPESVIRDACVFATRAQGDLAEVAPSVTRNRDEFKRLSDDVTCLTSLAVFYALKVQAAEAVLSQRGTTNTLDAKSVETNLQSSVEIFDRTAKLTDGTYRFANSMQTSHRKIPFPGAVDGKPANYHWSQVLPLYQKELADIRAQIAEGKPLLPPGKTKATTNSLNPEIAEPQ